MSDSPVNTDGADSTTESSDTSVEEPSKRAPSRDEATFAAAIGLTPPAGAKASKWALRRKAKPDTIGRPMVTADNAGLATATTGATATIAPQAPGSTNGTSARSTAPADAARVDTDTSTVPLTPGTARVAPSQPGPTGQPVRSPGAPVTAPVVNQPVVGVSPPAQESSPRAWWQRRRMRVRRVRRTIRHVDPWSVFKVSLILFACFYTAVMAAGVLLWNAAVGAGIIERVESFIEDVGVFETFEVDGQVVFRSAAIISVVLTAASAAMSVVFAILFNLISDLTGGVRVTVLEEDLGRPAKR